MDSLTLASDTQPDAVGHAVPVRPSGRVLRFAPHVVVWALLLAPMIQNMVRGWRPTSDDATIAIGAWRALSLHPPLLGQLTSAAGGVNASDPGPLEYWVLGPFVHLDPGQGVLLGSAILCALVLSVAIEVLRRTSGTWAAVIFTFVMVDMAIVSPTPFVDPVWNNSFGFFWFAAYLGVAFAVARGHLRYFALLLFIGSVAVDSNLLYAPTIVLLLVASLVVGWHTRRPANRRWLWWTVAVAAVCWVGTLYQQLFDNRPNLSILLRATPKTEGFVFGLRALSRAVSLNPIWTSPRPIGEFPAYADIAQRSLIPGLVFLAVLAAVTIAAWRRSDSILLSMCMVSGAGSVGIVFLFARTPSNDLISFIWINLAVWLVGTCIWLTLGLAVFRAVRPRLEGIRAQVAEVQSESGREPTRLSSRQRRLALVAVLGIAGLAGTLVTVFPYGDQFLLDWPAVARVQQMTADIEHRVPQGNVGMGIIYTGSNVFQTATDEHGVAYLLLTKGWVAGMQPSINQLLGLPIHPKSPFVVFTENGNTLTSARYYPVYQEFWFVTKK
jgi:hypothetical protein